MKLTAENVETVFFDCLYREEEVSNFPNGEPPKDTAMGEGVRGKFGFHPARLAAHKADVRSMLDELPDEFQDTKGGGMTFLNACMTKDDRQWREQITVDKLIALGIALGIVRFNLPREMWRGLPGGMPYFYVVSEGNEQVKS